MVWPNTRATDIDRSPRTGGYGNPYPVEEGGAWCQLRQRQSPKADSYFFEIAPA